MSDAKEWLLVKRDLYYRPDDLGYTGIRDHAGRYTYEEAKARAGHSVTMIKVNDAPEFTGACFEDLARAHITKQRDTLRAALVEVREKLFADENPLHAIEEALVPLDHALNQVQI